MWKSSKQGNLSSKMNIIKMNSFINFLGVQNFIEPWPIKFVLYNGYNSRFFAKYQLDLKMQPWPVDNSLNFVSYSKCSWNSHTFHMPFSQFIILLDEFMNEVILAQFWCSPSLHNWPLYSDSWNTIYIVSEKESDFFAHCKQTFSLFLDLHWFIFIFIRLRKTVKTNTEMIKS